MRKLLTFLAFLLTLLMLSSVAYGESALATFEQIMNGDYNGETVEARAIALPINYFNLRYVWAVQKADGSYEQISTSDSRWCVTEEDYNRANKAVKTAIDNKEPLIIEVRFSANGRPDVKKMYVSNYVQEEFFNSENISRFIWVMGCFIGVLVIIHIYERSERGKRAQMMARARPIKTKIIDSYHAVYTQKSTASVITRAAIGGMIGGEAGAMLGASTARNKHTQIGRTTFMVYYDNGVQQAETVQNDTYVYKKYMSLLDTGD